MRCYATLLVLLTLAAVLVAGACQAKPRPLEGPQVEGADGEYERKARLELIQRHIEPEVRDQRVIAAMKKVPRHLFVPEEFRRWAYDDRPLPVGHGQTISQPYIVAYMTEALRLSGKERVLEIGTGSGYQAAILAELAKEVYTIEIIEALGQRAKATLEALGYKNIKVRIGDGYRGWPEASPFDAIMLTAAPEEVPPPLLEQLADGGRLIAPVGGRSQQLVLYERHGNRISARELIPVIFVPMTGEAQVRGK